MKLGEVTCDAQSITTHRTPAGNKYRFVPMESCSVSDPDDFRYFEDRPSYEIEPTARGQLYIALAGDDETVEESIESFGYTLKQKLASSFGIKGNQKDEELTEELTEEAEKLKQEMEKL